MSFVLRKNMVLTSKDGTVWSRQGGISVEKANRYGNGYWWNYFIQMGKIDKNSREKAAVF